MLKRVGGGAVVVGLGFVVPVQAQTAFEHALHPGRGGVGTPAVVRQVQPKYTADALRAGIGGDVFLEAVVEADGTVGAVRVTHSLDSGLDRQAQAALKQWLFEPAMRDGQPVAVVVTVIVSFRPGDREEAPGTALSVRGPYLTEGVKTPGLVNPVLVHQVEPKYTADAMRAKIAGDVTVRAVVGTDGAVQRAWVVQSLDDQLDAQAVAAAKQWRFQPATLNGQPVASVVTLILAFHLH
jgi:TonB family protein